MWKNIHVELEFLRLEFHRFIFSFFFYAFYFLAFYFFLLLLRSSTLQIWRLDHLIAHLAFNHPIDQIGSPSIQSTRSSLHSSSILQSSRLCLFKSVLPLFFVRSFFLFFFKSAFNRPIGAPAFFVLPLFIVPLQIYSSFVLHQIVLLVLLQVCCSSSTKIESQRLAFAFLSSSL